MINPLLEGFDPPRRPLLFSCGILACCAPKRWVGLNCPNLATSGSAISAHFAKLAETRLRQSPSAIAGYSAWRIVIPPRERLLLVSAVPRGAAAPFAPTARFAMIGSWTVRRR